MDIQLIRDEYQKKFVMWDAFRAKLLELVRDLTQGNPRIYSIESRIKTLDSIIEKMNALGIDDLTQIIDVVGIRIVVYDFNDIDSLSHLLEQIFEVKYFEEKKWGDDPYLVAVHYTVSLGKDREKLVEYQQFHRMKAEFRIETLYYHSWQQASHILPIKESSNISTPLKYSAGRTYTGQLNAILDKFEELLEKDGIHETEIRKYIYNNQFIIHPNPTDIWTEVSIGLGTEFRMDFVIREADGSYILVELENPNLKLFTKNLDFTYQATHAQGQVEKWQEWIENNLSTVQKKYPVMMSPKGIVVMGRSIGLTDSELSRISRKNIIQRGNLTIKTYDDLILSARAYVSSLSNQLHNGE